MNQTCNKINCHNCCPNLNPNCPNMYGPTGPAGTSVLNYADFYALMPPDNAATIAPGTDVSFPKMSQIVALAYQEKVQVHSI